MRIVNGRGGELSMSNRLEKLIAILNSGASADQLAGLEAVVLQGINQRRQEFRLVSAVAPFGFVSIGFAMAIGVFIGSFTALVSLEKSSGTPLNSGASLAPSSLLEGGR
jgi:hypothetical protein